MRGKVGQIIEQQPRRQPPLLQHVSGQLFFRCFQLVIRDCIHLVPEVLTVQLGRVEAGQIRQRGLFGPVGKSPFASGMQRPINRCKKQGLTNIQPVPNLGREVLLKNAGQI